MPQPRLALVVLIALVITFSTSLVRAVTQPDGRVVPQLNAEEDASYAPGTALPKLFSLRSEQIDFQKDAVTSQATFTPTCGEMTGTLVLHGGGCNLDFGWYNVTASNQDPPSGSDIHVLVPADANPSFCPRVGPTPECPSGLIRFTIASVLSDSSYQGGPIGFAMRGDPTLPCSQTHYSEARFDLLCDDGTGHCPQCMASGVPGCSSDGKKLAASRWIMALVYQSTVSVDSYYLAFEDLPSDNLGYTAKTSQYQNDGDFNDDVYFVTGVTCAGAGTSCSTGLKGVCAAGVNQCERGRLVCKQAISPSTEICDGLDNDCNGQADDGGLESALCDSGLVCDKGQCFPYCYTQSYCNPSLLCTKRGTCVEPACSNVTCPSDQRCVHGACADLCSNVSCPSGQECRVGRCIDKCENIECGAGFVCSQGQCRGACPCTPCKGGEACLPDGSCVPAKCSATSCPAGQQCDGASGACVDSCSGVQCPGGLACQMGQCPAYDPVSGMAATGGQSGSSTGGGPGATGGRANTAMGGAGGKISGTGGKGTGGNVGVTGGSAGATIVKRMGGAPGGAAGGGTGGPEIEYIYTGCRCNAAAGGVGGDVGFGSVSLGVAFLCLRFSRRRGKNNS